MDAFYEGSLWGEAPLAPGSLTSEEEERETWTAESLRIAPSREEQSSQEVRSDEDFGGTRLKVTPWMQSMKIDCAR
jgi:hypothetical protein